MSDNPQSILLDPSLLNPLGDVLGPELILASSLNAHGLYNTSQFVLRLSPRVHEIVDSISPGVYSGVTWETTQAYSTYLHETVHWWQHVGSAAGLVLSLSYPAQTHGSLKALRSVLELVGPKKSLMRWAERAPIDNSSPSQEAINQANVAVNNALDIEYYKVFAITPSKAEALFHERYFESVGHSYRMAYSLVIALLGPTVDSNHEHIPDPGSWDNQFERLKTREHQGFFWGSPIVRGPLGLHAIFEGQARFIQLQYLAFGSGNRMSCAEFRAAGYLQGIYAEAFEVFLHLTKSAWPETIDDPLVGLFLIICDLAINPTRGFPLQIEVFENFIWDVDPGIRFARLCTAVSDEHPQLRAAIKQYSRDEYVSVAEKLTNVCGYDSPVSALEAVSDWRRSAGGIADVMKEYDSFVLASRNAQVQELSLQIFGGNFGESHWKDSCGINMLQETRDPPL
jgi:hypothetical protein